MSLILHLSDLHLSLIDNDEIFGDYKSEIVPRAERITRHGRLRGTLRELKILLDGQKLDAIVITGDVTVGNDEKGFELLGGFLSELDTSLPNPDRIVVTPGNHDVTWFSPASSEDRYKNFIKHIRSKGFITPILDGIDVDQSGSLHSDLSKHYVLGPDNEWLIVPINSSNYCGSIEPVENVLADIWPKLPLAAPPDRQDVVRKLLERLRLRDVIRISPQQLEALAALLDSAEEKLKAAGKDPRSVLRMAAIHHHLLPVSTIEEFKAFESITNLGLLRHFFRSRNFKLVLHGHKHTGYAYWDHIYELPGVPQSSSHDVLVFSGATIGGTDYRQEEVCRLIDVNAREYAPMAQIKQVPAVDPGARLPELKGDYIPLWRTGATVEEMTGEITVIEGTTVDETYARILTTFDMMPSRVRLSNVICQVAAADTAKALPAGYPDIPSVQPSGRQEWFQKQLDWWQRPVSLLIDSLHFTHGSRIKKFGNDQIDQLMRAAKLLDSHSYSSRAVITLVDPGLDVIDEESRKFPSFCFIQFIVRGKVEDLKLDCIGYFRKQELKYWWPINIAELAMLQEAVFNRLKSRYPGISKGTLTTIAAIASAGLSLPKVAVPLIDRMCDDEPKRLWSMAYAIFSKLVPNRDEYAELWKRVLEDLIPPQKPTPDGVPVATVGLRYLKEVLEHFRRHHAESIEAKIVDHLSELEAINAQHSTTTAVSDPDDEQYKKWRERVIHNIDQLNPLLKQVFGQE